jgi:methylenetetrahydrofolate--tRNA-(uracil-5-)-methyltransferase
MESRTRRGLFFGGQITGVEGYVGNVATGLVAAINMARQLERKSAYILPETTMIGALCHYITHAEPKHFQPMKANFGIMPELENPVKNKRDRYVAYAERANKDMQESIAQLEDAYLQSKASQPYNVPT